MMLRVIPGEALGNRLLLAAEREVGALNCEEGRLAQSVCGAGVDGLLLVGERRDGVRRVRIFNRDGSDGEVCLNGLRLAAVHDAQDTGMFLMAGRQLPWRRVPEGIELHLRRQDLPAEWDLRQVSLRGQVGIHVPFWNPHCVIPVDDVDRCDLADLARKAAAELSLFPHGVNLEAIADDGEGRLRMRVWERGVGETRACGSGAVAVAVAAWAGGHPGPIEVAMPGGSLYMSLERDGGIRLRGGATLGSPIEVQFEPCRA